MLPDVVQEYNVPFQQGLFIFVGTKLSGRFVLILKWPKFVYIFENNLP